MTRLKSDNDQNGSKKQFHPLPTVTDAVLLKVKQACEACEAKADDVFVKCLRGYGASAAEVAAVILLVLPGLVETEPLTIQQLLDAVVGYVAIAQAA